MSAKFTPGPWAFDGESRVDALQFRKPSPYKSEDGAEYMQGLVALPYGCGDPETHVGNALLIAAAPELLDALRELREQCNEVRPFVNAVATDASVKDIRRVSRFMAACEKADAAIAKAEGAAS